MKTDHSQPASSAPALAEIPHWLCLSLLAAFVMVLLWKALFLSPGEVLSDGRMDVAYFFVHWRYFGFHELKSGNLALWNPHCYCGTPFFGNFQSALLYPLNFLFLLAPLAAAINWTIALHVFLGGVFTFYWVRHRGLHSLACLLSAMMFMFCGPHFLQIQAGHLPNLCTLIWAPLLFLAIDQLTDRPAAAPCLLGMFAMTMAILAGHPQYVFYMGVAAGIYAALNLVRARQRGKIMLGLGVIVAGGIGLSAVQLFTGLNESGESLRSLGMSFTFASSFSFPPENFLTLLAPWFFGDGKNCAYWSRWYLTEVSLFVSVMGLALAICGMAMGKRDTRRFSITLLIIVLILAMGSYTPLFRLLFNYVPGFNLFRGMDKFLWLAALFLSMLAGIGLDSILRGRTVPRWLMGGMAGLGIALCGLAILAHRLDWWAGVLKKVQAGQARLAHETIYSDPHFIALSSAGSGRSLIEGAACLFFATGLLALAKSRRRMACGGMILLAMIELACFAQTSLRTFKIGPAYPPAITEGLAQNPGDYRIKAQQPNAAMTAGTLDIGGDDPSGLLRYRRYLNFTLGIDDETALFEAPRKVYNAAGWRMLRFRYLLMENRDAHANFYNDLPRLLLVDHFRLMTDYHEMFLTLTNASFHPEEEVILESRPEIAPQPAREKGTVKLLESATDYAIVEADAKTPCLLFMTDAYSRGWRALALPGSSQTQYRIMPADYCLRAIPLAAGHHLLRIEYSPLGFRIGRVVSIAAWALFIILAVAQKSQWSLMLKIETGPRAAL